jgi:hypothetical protein
MSFADRRNHPDHECRCACGLLLGIHKGDELHVKYKEFTAVVRGAVRVCCRRCGRHVEVCTKKGAAVAA